jgi:hypothetical protein
MIYFVLLEIHNFDLYNMYFEWNYYRYITIDLIVKNSNINLLLK